MLDSDGGVGGECIWREISIISFKFPTEPAPKMKKEEMESAIRDVDRRVDAFLASTGAIKGELDAMLPLINSADAAVAVAARVSAARNIGAWYERWHKEASERLSQIKEYASGLSADRAGDDILYAAAFYACGGYQQLYMWADESRVLLTKCYTGVNFKLVLE